MTVYKIGSNIIRQNGGSGLFRLGASEFVGSAAGLDLQAHPLYRIDMSAQDYPTFLTAGATHTYEATGAWDGGPCAKLVPPNSGGADGYSALGGWHLDNDGTFAIHALNIRWEAALGPTFVTNWAELIDIKWVIVNSGPSLGDNSTDQRPIVHFYKQAGTNTLAMGVGAGTLSQFNPSAPPDDFGPVLSRVDFFHGPTDTTLSGKPVLGAGTWLTYELRVIAQSTTGNPNGLIQLRVWSRAGTLLTDIDITWLYDDSWTLPRWINESQVIGGFFNEVYSSIDADTYQRIAGVTFAVDHSGFMGPRAGFVS